MAPPAIGTNEYSGRHMGGTNTNINMTDDMNGDTNDFAFAGFEGIMDDYLVSFTSSPQHNVNLNSSFAPQQQNQRVSSPPQAQAQGPADPETVHSSPDSPSVWRLANGVHMEVQDNAKIPNINWNVDRSNSTHYRSRQERRQDGEERRSHPQHHSHTPSMEWFLSDSRKNQNPVFAHKGVLTQNTASLRFEAPKERTFSFSGGANNTKNFFDESTLDDLTAGIDPTPLDEIKRRHSPENLESSAPSNQPPAQPANTVNSRPGDSIASVTSSFRGYVPRPYPLPIPTARTNDQNTSDTGTQNARQVSTQSSNTDTPQKPGAQGDNTGSLGTMTSQSQNSTPSQQQKEHPHHHEYHHNHILQPCHKSARASSTGALHNASNQKTQYGFGTDHLVPSVPSLKKPSASSKRRSPFPPHVKSNSRATSTTSLSSCPEDHNRPPSQMSNGSEPHGAANAGAAYERKKQRAKNARIKLNESIDSLAVAINLAGSQSKQRGLHMDQMKREKQKLVPIPNQIVSASGPASNGVAGATSNGLSFSANMRGVVKECVDISENARKWDRPSFVGSAASLIQALNTQCEALMRELSATHEQNIMLLKQRQQQAKVNSNDMSRCSTCSCGDRNDAEVAVNGKRVHSLDGVDNQENSGKRQRVVHSIPNATVSVDESNTQDEYNKVLALEAAKAETIASLLKNRKVMGKIMSFFEPKVAARCLLRVSKNWTDGQFFETEPIWQNLCIKRYGFYNYRQWKAKTEEDSYDKKPAARKVANENDKVASMSLFRSMDDYNIMPHFRRPEGLVFLGDGKLPGKVSAWTFFVERSNGETMRSVLRKPGDFFGNRKSSVQYTSMPVVQMWTVIQNTAIGWDEPIVIREQNQVVDASTRRRKDEMKEIDWDERFQKRILNLDGTPYKSKPNQCKMVSAIGAKELCRLDLFEAVIIETNIHAQGCSTTSKFVQRSNYTKLIVQVPTVTTVSLVIPFPRDTSPLPI